MYACIHITTIYILTFYLAFVLTVSLTWARPDYLTWALALPVVSSVHRSQTPVQNHGANKPHMCLSTAAGFRENMGEWKHSTLLQCPAKLCSLRVGPKSSWFTGLLWRKKLHISCNIYIPSHRSPSTDSGNGWQLAEFIVVLHNSWAAHKVKQPHTRSNEPSPNNNFPSQNVKLPGAPIPNSLFVSDYTRTCNERERYWRWTVLQNFKLSSQASCGPSTKRCNSSKSPTVVTLIGWPLAFDRNAYVQTCKGIQDRHCNITCSHKYQKISKNDMSVSTLGCVPKPSNHLQKSSEIILRLVLF